MFAIRDRTPSDGFKREESSGIGRRILEDPTAYGRKTTRIVGQFRGRNFFGDLPSGSGRGKDDWVLKDGDVAISVTGKDPKGDGWELDPDYKGDSKRWLEVEGKPEIVNGIIYLKASRVLIAKADNRP